MKTPLQVQHDLILATSPRITGGNVTETVGFVETNRIFDLCSAGDGVCSAYYFYDTCHFASTQDVQNNVRLYYRSRSQMIAGGQPPLE